MQESVWVLLLVACAGLGVGCQEDSNGLSGSVGEIYDLSFHRVRARQYDSEFSIEYTREDGQIPVGVIVERNGDESLSEGEIDLEERGTIVGRVGPRRLPAFGSGTLNLDAYRPAQGARIEGSFDATLRADDSTYTLSGVFSTTLDIVDESIGYRFPDAGGDAWDGGGGDDSGGVERADGAGGPGDGSVEAGP